MPGLKIVIPTNFTDTTMPILRDDPVLPGQGALMLIDPAHSLSVANGWSINAAPSIGVHYPNIAQDQGRLAIGDANADLTTWIETLDFADTSYGGPAYGFVERTPKGGYHAAFTQRDYNSIQSFKGFTLGMPGSIKSYFAAAANASHQFYVSLWSRETRIPPAGSNPHWSAYIGKATSITAGVSWGAMDSGGWVHNGAGTAIIDSYDDGNKLGLRRKSAWANNYAGTWDGGPQGAVFNIGTYGTENTYLDAKSHSACQVFYRFYLEDLTVSGRNYTEVDALDAAAFADAFAAGGRYADDTVPTDPATVA